LGFFTTDALPSFISGVFNADVVAKALDGKIGNAIGSDPHPDAAFGGVTAGGSVVFEAPVHHAGTGDAAISRWLGWDFGDRPQDIVLFQVHARAQLVDAACLAITTAALLYGVTWQSWLWFPCHSIHHVAI
jgi:hypothetical protein